MIVMIFIEKNLEKNQNVLTPRGSIDFSLLGQKMKNEIGSKCPFKWKLMKYAYA